MQPAAFFLTQRTGSRFIEVRSPSLLAALGRSL
jgi:hypothetical protein